MSIQEMFEFVGKVDNASDVKEDYEKLCHAAFEAIDCGGIKMSPYLHNQMRQLEVTAEEAKFQMLKACE